MTASRRDGSGLAVALLVACTVVWGSNVVVGRAVVENVPPVGLAFWRNVFAALVILPFCAREMWAAREALRRELPLLLLVGGLGTALFNAVVYWALETTTAINAALMMSLVPVIVPIMAYFWANERLTTRQGFGILLSLLGVGVVISRGDPAVLRSLSFVRGDLLMAVGMLCWCLYSVAIKRRPAEVGSLPFFGAVLVLATAILLPFYLLESAVVSVFPTTANAFGAALYVGIFPTALALLIFNWAVSVLGANRTALFNHLVPLFATLLAIVFLGETFAAYHAAGAILIAGGLVASTLGASAPVAAAALSSRP